MKSAKVLAIFFMITMAAADTYSSYAQTKGGGYGWDPRRYKNCNYNPQVCQVAGSAGPDCCNGQCVDLSTSWFSCGRCSKKCGFSQICCGGKCVSPYVSKDHCGRCNNTCEKGSFCNYGMCSYV